MNAAFTPNYPPVTALHCPIIQKRGSHHIHLDDEHLDNPGISSSPLCIPSAGALCFFTRRDGRSFLGRITRTIQWQRSQSIVRVEHDNELGSFALAIPHHRRYQGWMRRIVQLLSYWSYEDSEELAEGVSIDPVDQFWEVDDEVQQGYYKEPYPLIQIVIEEIVEPPV